MAESILKVSKLVKKFGQFTAVNAISFEVPRGKIIGLLGPNGAGKTTTIHMLLGITIPNQGRIEYFGKEFEKNKTEILQKINFTSSFNTLLGRITVFENLKVFARLYSTTEPDKKIKEYMNYFEVSSLANQQYWDLSAGQKTRVNLIKSLLNDPELILMDEPTASLDPDIADKTLTLIEDLNKTKGVSILYTSHEMDEVTRICDEVIFLQKGNIVASDSPINLTKEIDDCFLILKFDAQKNDVAEYLSRNKLEHSFEHKSMVSIKTHETELSSLIAKMNKVFTITDLEIKKPTLEDVFLRIAREGKHELEQN